MRSQLFFRKHFYEQERGIGKSMCKEELFGRAVPEIVQERDFSSFGSKFDGTGT